ncbi:MAG: FAD-dependent oxidoreductase [Oligoflexia bacterium]|nr:FAD-dependent oxidoreductase [Oligoflexia bacterium]MBF0366954.1 FAD-dependent oxidoreductase [Oligoflexia bacterium]
MNNGQSNRCDYDLVIVGGGITGTGLLYMLCRYSTLKRILLVEKYQDVGRVNSARTHNSQTLHFGDIETNYTLEKATKVNQTAVMIKHYVEEEKRAGRRDNLFSKYNKMVLAVGPEQVVELSKRYEEFKQLFPRLQKIDRQRILELEPLVVKGRDEDEELLALSTDEGYTIDFQNLAHSFVENALASNSDAKMLFNTKIVEIIPVTSGGYCLRSNEGNAITARTVVVSTGGHSLMMAQKLGHGCEYSLLSVAGSFYWAPHVLNGKVYTLQNKKLPFAAIHGDPEVHNAKETRFGPTAKAIPFLERRNWSSFFDYIQSCGLNFASILALFKILSDKTIFTYIFKNFLYDLPFIGKRLFIKEVRKIIPTLKLKELIYAKGMGGTRPQIVNTRTRKLELGEAKVMGENIIFNITPSPGASNALGNAYNDSIKIMEFFKGEFTLDKESIEKDLIKK